MPKRIRDGSSRAWILPRKRLPPRLAGCRSGSARTIPGRVRTDLGRQRLHQPACVGQTPTPSPVTWVCKPSRVSRQRIATGGLINGEHYTSAHPRASRGHLRTSGAAATVRLLRQGPGLSDSNRSGDCWKQRLRIDISQHLGRSDFVT